jgi:AraC-like DNA-binding protein
VIYIEHIPATPLNRCVRLLWYVQAPDAGASRQRILPTGCASIIFNLARDFISECGGVGPVNRLAPNLAVGARSTYQIVDTSDLADLIGIEFQPGGFAPFVGDAVDRLSDRIVPLDAIWGTKAASLRDRLRELPSPKAKLRFLESFLCETFPDRFTRSAWVDFALASLAVGPNGESVSRVKEIARRSGWSERRFSQIFREEVGFPPKVWSRIGRFQKVVRSLHAATEVCGAELALDCGYYDQSHFANEFRAFSGIDVTAYSGLRRYWANQVPTSE